MSARAPAPRPPPPAPRPRRRRRWLIVTTVAGLGIAVGVGLYFGMVVARRIETGRWEVIKPAEVAAAVSPPAPRGPARVIFLERAPITLGPGPDEAHRGLSSVLAHHHPDGPVKLPGWKGSAANWKKLVACVQTLFAPFDVSVTDQRPTAGDFVLVAVGGKPADIGLKSKQIAGLAPFHGGVIDTPVVFAFAATLRHAVRTTCETIGMEVAHAYGLDHGYLCKDVMSYLKPCGARSFVDKDVACGEEKKRACHGGAPTQNSYRALLGVLGAARPAAP